MARSSACTSPDRGRRSCSRRATWPSTGRPARRRSGRSSILIRRSASCSASRPSRSPVEACTPDDGGLPVDIQMPQLGETVTEGTITRWLKSVGDHVEADEPLFEVSTDKVDSEVPAPAAGTLSEILVQEGETAEVGTRLAVLSDGAGAGATTAAAPPQQAPPPQQQAQPQEPPPQQEPPQPEPVSPPAAQRTQAAPPQAPSGPPPTTSAAPPQASTGGHLMSPVVRRLLNEYSLDAAEVQGTGEGGRITRNDVLDAAVRRQAPAAPAATPTAATPPQAPARAATPPPAATAPTASPAPPQAPARPAPDETAPTTSAAPPPAPAEPAAPPQAPAEPAAPPSAAARTGDEIVPFDNIRRRTAEHMVRSKATSASTGPGAPRRRTGGSARASPSRISRSSCSPSATRSTTTRT